MRFLFILGLFAIGFWMYFVDEDEKEVKEKKQKRDKIESIFQNRG